MHCDCICCFWVGCWKIHGRHGCPTREACLLSLLCFKIHDHDRAPGKVSILDRLLISCCTAMMPVLTKQQDNLAFLHWLCHKLAHNISAVCFTGKNGFSMSFCNIVAKRSPTFFSSCMSLIRLCAFTGAEKYMVIRVEGLQSNVFASNRVLGFASFARQN